MIWGLHGAVGMAEDWDVFGEIQGVDLWSFLKEGEMSLDEAGQKVAEMASDGDTLVGYSMGGRIALHALGKRQWKKVIIVSAHPGLESAHQERLKNDERWAGRALGDWDRFLEEWNSQGVFSGSVPDWGDRIRLRSRAQEVARSFRCWSLGTQRRFEEFEGPVTWVVGARDEKFVTLAGQLEGVDLVVVSGAGHRVPWEKLDDFRRFVGCR